MKREGCFERAYDEWAKTTRYRNCIVTQLKNAMFSYVFQKKDCYRDDVSLDDVLEIGVNIKRQRNIGKQGVKMYFEFVEWAENIIQAEESKVNPEADKWEQRKFEVAKEVFIALVQRQEVANIVQVADTAVKVADGFIRIYKQNEL